MGVIKLYRCLNPIECREIRVRNPEVEFSSNLSKFKVKHKIYRGTNWDEEMDNYPLSILQDDEGRRGDILVRVDWNILVDDWHNSPGLYPPHYFEESNRRWWVADNTAVWDVWVEKIVEVVPLDKNQKSL